MNFYVLLMPQVFEKSLFLFSRAKGYVFGSNRRLPGIYYYAGDSVSFPAKHTVLSASGKVFLLNSYSNSLVFVNILIILNAGKII